MTEIFLLDANSIGFAAHSGAILKVGDQQTQAVFGFIRALRAMQMSHPRAYKAILWDGDAKWRKVIYPDYKGNRETNAKMKAVRDAYRSQRPLISRAVKALGYDQMMSPTAEADDLAAALAQKFSVKMGREVRLITGDKDWMQLINERCSWHDHVRDTFVNLSNFETHSGGLTKPQQIVDLKALMGDTSDNIKGCGGIGEVGAHKLLKAFGSVARFLDMYKAGKIADCPTPWQNLAQNKEGRLDRYYMNVQLMNLLGAVKPGVQDRQLTKGVYDEDAFITLAEELAFHSITANAEVWLAPFKRRNNS